MEILKKGNIKIAVRDKNQLAAFLNNRWEVVEREPVEKKSEYKKSDISKMNVEDLKKLATQLEIEGAEESTGEALKAAVIEKLGL